MSLLSALPSITKRAKKRVGRGIGSGLGGHTAGRGMKGQKSRRGAKVPVWFEGGQLPLIKRLPMWRGKSRLNVVRPTAEVTLTDINRMTAEEITLDTLKLEKVIDARFRKAKIIATGSIDRAVTIIGIPVSAQAQKAITKVGGTIETQKKA